jgi:4-alpha-glucanotransferase
MVELERTKVLREALSALGIRNFVLAVHDASQPAGADDLGRGTSNSEAAGELLQFAASLGFNGVQLGPQGQTSDINASPYDGTLFARNTMNIPLRSLVAQGFVSEEEAQAALSAVPPSSRSRVAYEHAFKTYGALLEKAYGTFTRHRDAASSRARTAAFSDFLTENQGWLRPAGLYPLLSGEHGVGDWQKWGGGLDFSLDQRLFGPASGEASAVGARLQALTQQHAQALEAFAFEQWLVHDAHDQLRARCRTWGLKLYGDLQVGFSPLDLWAHRATVLPGYRMGAPPSRTNLEGQPWNYAVLDPAQYSDGKGGLGPALRVVQLRMQKMLREYDGVRIDHPHGLICPWVYRTDDPDPLHAVQTGARLFDSPNVAGHEALARLAIARPEQLNPTVARYADDWVASLEESQVAQYSALFDVVVEAAKDNGRSVEDLVCEVLSTQPYPLRRVLARYGLGRFRVTQKADLQTPTDVYRSENARPADWIMLGTHDTPPLWRLVPQWRAKGTHLAQASYLAERLGHTGTDGERFAQLLASDDRLLAHAKFADVLASPAHNVMVFFPDLFGMQDIYNAPGVVSPDNWMLRVPPNWREGYEKAARERSALNLPLALDWALQARGLPRNEAERALLVKLEELAKA